MSQENSLSVEASPNTVVFNMQGDRVEGVTSPAVVIEPEAILSNDAAMTLSQYIQSFTNEHQTTPAIGLRFAKFADGRSYSMAARLREAGYSGELHAMGDINQELLFLLKRVGFTHAHIPDPGVERLASAIVTPFAGYYQAGLDGSKAPWQQGS